MSNSVCMSLLDTICVIWLEKTIYIFVLDKNYWDIINNMIDKQLSGFYSHGNVLVPFKDIFQSKSK